MQSFIFRLLTFVIGFTALVGHPGVMAQTCTFPYNMYGSNSSGNANLHIYPDGYIGGNLICDSCQQLGPNFYFNGPNYGFGNSTFTTYCDAGTYGNVVGEVYYPTCTLYVNDIVGFYVYDISFLQRVYLNSTQATSNLKVVGYYQDTTPSVAFSINYQWGYPLFCNTEDSMYFKAYLIAPHPEEMDWVPTYAYLVNPSSQSDSIANCLFWYNAVPYIPSEHNQTFIQRLYDFHLIPAAPLVGGSGGISGNISLGSNKTAVDGLENATVFVFNPQNQNNPVAYSFADSFGNWQISDLPLGTYLVKVDLIGRYDPGTLVTLTAGNPVVTNVSTEMSSDIPNGVSVPISSPEFTVKVHPNPCDQMLKLTLENAPVSTHLMVTNLNGRVIFEQVMPGGTGNIDISTREWPTGIYHVQLITDGVLISRRVVVAH